MKNHSGLTQHKLPHTETFTEKCNPPTRAFSQTKAKVSLAAFYEWKIKSVDQENWIVQRLYIRAIWLHGSPATLKEDNQLKTDAFCFCYRDA